MRLGLKMMMVVALTLAILVPLMLIFGTIQERQRYRDQVVQDVAANFGGRQVIAGPVLVVPYVETTVEDVEQPDGSVRRVSRRTAGQWTYFPGTLSIQGVLHPDTRRRGLHEVRVYQWNGRVSAQFDVTVSAAPAGGTRRIGQPFLGYAIADVAGLQGTPQLRIDGTPVAVGQGLGHADAPGVHVRLAEAAAGQRLRLRTELDLRLRGTETFGMVPLGGSNDLRVSSSWRHPRFEGRSPKSDLDGAGFRARWQVAAVASDAQRRYRQSPGSLVESAAGAEPQLHAAFGSAGLDGAVAVSLIDPVNPYLMTERATKYGLLFVALTFAGFFMFELIRQVPVHPVQYLLVGAAIAIFFLLLLSLSEHIAFGLAYVVAAAACVGLIGFYLSAVLRGTLRGIGFAAMLGTLYAALYGLLLSEDNALVMGAGLLFAILAAIMVATRKVDWYRVGSPVPDAR
jgi:inner membrane protein